MRNDVEPSRVICAVDELSDPGAREFSLGASAWPLNGFVVRYQDKIFAYRNSCPHAGHALNWRPDRFFTADNTLLICSSHGALFAPDSGECIAGPCVGRALRALEVEVINGQVILRGPPDALPDAF